jgi:hypothetical protein
MGLDTTSLANIAIAVSAAIALVFGILQVQAAVRDRRERLTIEVVRALQTREFAQEVAVLRQHPPPTTAEEWTALPESTRVTHMHFLQQMEMLGLLVFDGSIDLKLVERTLGAYVSMTWKRFEPVILELRRRLPDPYLSEYYQYNGGRDGDVHAGSPAGAGLRGAPRRGTVTPGPSGVPGLRAVRRCSSSPVRPTTG